MRKKKSQMSYQVRHKEFGIFQGEFMGLGFWWPMSEEPEQGLYEFLIEVEACAFIAYYVKSGIGDFVVENFTIESFDKKLDFEMQLVEIEEK